MPNTVLSSFDPLATHPFTNNSGLLPKPAPPSQFPHALPASKAHPSHPAPGPIILTTAPVHAPQPKRAVPAPSSSHRSSHSAYPSSSGPKPVFVPFRPDRSSPDLEDILLKKKFADAFQGKAAWGIDQVAVPLQAGRQGKAQ